MTNLEFFRLYATEFVSMPDEDVEKYFLIVDMIISSGPYSDEEWAFAQALYVAHMIAYNARSAENSTGGIISSEREGDLSRSYKALSKDPTFLSSTTYGVLFDNFSKGIIGPSFMTRMG